MTKLNRVNLEAGQVLGFTKKALHTASYGRRDYGISRQGFPFEYLIPDFVLSIVERLIPIAVPHFLVFLDTS